MDLEGYCTCPRNFRAPIIPSMEWEIGILSPVIPERDHSMERAKSSFRAAEMRLDRAVSTVSAQLRKVGKTDDELKGAVHRIVIFANTVAEALSASEQTQATRQAADLLWKLGEGLHMINTDGSRPSN